MNRDLQCTLAKTVGCAGIGIHSGVKTQISIEPANSNFGIVFIRSDLKRDNAIPALFDRVIDSTMCTKIANEKSGVSVATIEHLMSALWGCGIDNALIQVDGPEIPIMDGSSNHFVQVIKSAGIIQQDADRRFLQIKNSLKVDMGDQSISVEPNDFFAVNFEIDFKNAHVQKQMYTFQEEEDFELLIGKARTFGFLKDFEQLRNQRLALGASLCNAIAIGDHGILNKEGLRYENEFVRHKVLDCIGDLYLAGARIKGKITAIKSGHKLNNMLLRKLLQPILC